MSYATLMVYVDVEGKPDGRVSVAADLARRFDAYLIGIASGAPISAVLGEDAPNEAAAQTPHLRDMKALLDRRGQEFRAAIGTSSRRVEWRSVVGLQADVVAREARAADLVIISNARASRDPFRALDPGSFILKAGRPVLVVFQFLPRRGGRKDAGYRDQIRFSQSICLHHRSDGAALR